MKLESKIQAKRIKELEAEGYYVIRLITTNKHGIPDLIAIPPDSGVLFEEIKRKGNKPSKLQAFRHRELRDHGCVVQIYEE